VCPADGGPPARRDDRGVGSAPHPVMHKHLRAASGDQSLLQLQRGVFGLFSLSARACRPDAIGPAAAPRPFASAHRLRFRIAGRRNAMPAVSPIPPRRRRSIRPTAARNQQPQHPHAGRITPRAGKKGEDDAAGWQHRPCCRRRLLKRLNDPWETKRFWGWQSREGSLREGTRRKGERVA